MFNVLSLNVTWISLAMCDRSIYYPVYVKPSKVSWRGISSAWNINGHHSLFIAFFLSFLVLWHLFCGVLGAGSAIWNNTVVTLQIHVLVYLSDLWYLPVAMKRSLMQWMEQVYFYFKEQIFKFDAIQQFISPVLPLFLQMSMLLYKSQFILFWENNYTAPCVLVRWSNSISSPRHQHLSNVGVRSLTVPSSHWDYAWDSYSFSCHLKLYFSVHTQLFLSPLLQTCAKLQYECLPKESIIALICTCF